MESTLIRDSYYDRNSNKTHALIQTPEFVQWFWVSGQLASAADLLATLEYSITKAQVA